MTIVAFFQPSPPYRDNALWLLGVGLAVHGIRLLVERRLPAWIPLWAFFLIFIPMSVYNFNAAPYTRADYLVLVSRSFLGFWMIIYAVEHTRRWRTLTWLVSATIGMGIVLALIALTASQWQWDKLSLLEPIVRAVPRVDFSQYALTETLYMSFNPNEIAGALAYVCPFLLGIALGYARLTETKQPDNHTKRQQVLPLLAGCGFAFVLVALIFGQSRFALAGVYVALPVVIWLTTGHTFRRYALLLLTTGLVIFQTGLVLGWFQSSASGNSDSILSSRDERTVTTRFDLWQRGFQMMLDYPATGVGMSRYRVAVREDRYQIPYYEDRAFGPPHAHNEIAQVAADFGIPGLLWFIGLYGVTALMLWRGWRSDIPSVKVVSIAVAGGLLAHAVYGIGDAITLWDRYIFVFWWMLALAGAVYARATFHN